MSASISSAPRVNDIPSKFDGIIIGGGPAGASAAIAAADGVVAAVTAEKYLSHRSKTKVDWAQPECPTACDGAIAASSGAFSQLSLFEVGVSMQVAMNSTTVTNITSAELREYLKTEHERSFVLIDVRQSEEYMDGHIPGARLIPLNELEAYAEELKQLSNRRLIFYCRSGGRSARASAWASQVLGLPGVCNLLGGFLGWDGQVLVDFPRLTPFDLLGSTDTLLRRALELEKGTYLLYSQLATEYKSGVLAATISGLVNAELQHGQAVHQLLAQMSQDSQQSFEQAFADLPGSIIENGMSFDAVLGRARELGSQGELALLELALEIELGAYDLYKNLATTVASEQAQRALGELAQQEKAHADAVLGAIGRMAKAMSRIAS